jgi:hypothetical protein
MSSLDPESNVAYSGQYNLFLTVGFTSSNEIYKLTLLLQLISITFGCISLVHSISLDSFVLNLVTTINIENKQIDKRNITNQSNTKAQAPLRILLGVFDNSNLRLNFHIGPLIGLTSILWSGHLIHKSIPVSRGLYKTSV